MFPGVTHDGTRKDKHQFLSATAASIEHVGDRGREARKELMGDTSGYDTCFGVPKHSKFNMGMNPVECSSQLRSNQFG